MTAPVRLKADNFTPAKRTPWGGTHIVSRYKAQLGITCEGVVGEAWEVSVEPSFPSHCIDGTVLADQIATDPEAWLGTADAERYGQCPLLVKLLDADDNLSVQVHPTDDDPDLAGDESGKPESWVVLDARPGAGLYLGFRDGVARSDVQACLTRSGPLDELMTFVPVTAGDAFIIEAGTPHAIGAGVTLLEPQHVAPGRRGVTYRFWDWNRRYDEQGERDLMGQPRALHVDRSLTVTSWDAPRGDAFIRTCRAACTTLADGSLRRDRVVDWRWFQVERWSGSGALSVHTDDRLLALTCVGGSLDIESGLGDLHLRRGESGVIPAKAGHLEVRATDGLVFVTKTNRTDPK